VDCVKIGNGEETSGDCICVGVGRLIRSGEELGVPNWNKGDVWLRGEVVTVECGGRWF
jgi:hypothetical protein